LVDGRRNSAETVKQQVRSTLMQIFIRRLILTFESRLSDNWNMKAADYLDGDWDEIEKLLLDRVDDTLQRRSGLLLGENGEIARDLDANRDLMTEALTDPNALMRLLLLITQGRVITFDERTHRRKLKAALRLTYIFLAARLLEERSVEDAQAGILDHLEAAQDQLALIWGSAELLRLHNAGHTLSNLTADWQEKLSDSLGSDLFDRIKDEPLDQLSQPDRNQLVFTLGKFTQNRLYRHLLLDKISELWVEYLTRVEALRVSVRMEAYGQKDPLVSYKGQASEMFSNLLSDIRAGVIDQMFRVRLVRQEDTKQAQSAPQKAPVKSDANVQRQPKKKSRKRH